MVSKEVFCKTAVVWAELLNQYLSRCEPVSFSGMQAVKSIDSTVHIRTNIKMIVLANMCLTAGYLTFVDYHTCLKDFLHKSLIH